jgi:N-acetylmuramoyl-L-alanine amidase
MHRNRLSLLAFFALFLSTAQAGTTVENIRIWSEGGKTRVVLDLSEPVPHTIFTLRGPDRLVVDLKEGRLASSLTSDMPGATGSVKGIRTAIKADGQLRVVLDLSADVRSRSFTAGPNASYGDRLVIDLQHSGSPQAIKRASESYKPGRDVVIAIDAGHGGHDPGALGSSRTREKDVALQISRRLAAKINAERGMKAVLVRDGDYYVDHVRRMAIAHKHDADLFVSIHADAFKDRRANGATVYALSLGRASSEEARLLAERENAAVMVGGVSLNDKDRVLAEVLLDLSQNAAMSASLDVGEHVVQSLKGTVRVRRDSVQQGNLVVLTSPDMPSILIETGYITNPGDEKRLRDATQQSKLASSILGGFRNYFYTNPPPDTQIAMDIRTNPSREVRHVIARGDTLSEIAARYNTSLAAIRSANRLSNDKIRVGQTLSIPIYPGS